MTKSQNSADGGDVAVEEQQDIPAIVSTQTMLLLKGLDGKLQKNDGRGATTDRGTLKEASQVLPLELLVIVAQFLAGTDQYGTLRALNSTGKLVRTETLPILCETVTAPDSGGGKRAAKEFMKKHGKLIKYLIKHEDFRTPSEASNIRVEMTQGERLVRNRQSNVIYVPAASARISNVVSAATFEHLIRLSSPTTVDEGDFPAPLPLPVVEVCHVFGLGRIVGGHNGFSVYPWSFYYEADSNFEFDDGNSKEGLPDTMRYLFQAFPPHNWEFEDGASVLARISFSNVVAFQAFIDSFEGLLQRRVFPKIQLQTGRVTIDDIMASMPAVAAVFAANWSLITPSNYLLKIDLDIDESDGYRSDDRESNDSVPDQSLLLIFDASDAADFGAEQGVTFRLRNYQYQFYLVSRNVQFVTYVYEGGIACST